MQTTRQVSVTMPLEDFKALLAAVVREEIKAYTPCPTGQEEEALSTIKEACALLKLTRPTVYKLMKQGKLPYMYLAKNRLRFPKAGLLQYLRGQDRAQNEAG